MSRWHRKRRAVLWGARRGDWQIGGFEDHARQLPFRAARVMRATRQFEEAFAQIEVTLRTDMVAEAFERVADSIRRVGAPTTGEDDG